MTSSPSPITDVNLWQRLSWIVDKSVGVDEIMGKGGLSENDTIIPAYLENLRQVQESASSLIHARWQESGDISAAFVRLNSAVEALEKNVGKIHPEVQDIGQQALLEAYTMQIVASSEGMINRTDAQYKARGRFPAGGKPPANFYEPGRW